jgi:hypothetical protein
MQTSLATPQKTTWFPAAYKHTGKIQLTFTSMGLNFKDLPPFQMKKRMIAVSKQNQNFANITLMQSKEKEEEKHPFKSRQEQETIVHLESSHLRVQNMNPRKIVNDKYLQMPMAPY